jgi:TonB family protein
MPKFLLYALGSLVTHAALVVAVQGGSGHGPVAMAAAKAPANEIEVDPAAVMAPKVEEAEEAPLPAVPAAGARAATPHAHTHPYLVAEDHDTRPHDPAIEHEHAMAIRREEAAEAAAAVAGPADAPMPRFTMSLGGAVHANGAVATVGAATGAGTALAAGEEHVGGAVLSESQVSVPAKLALRVEPEYPASARMQEIEAEVPLEIVVDTSGAVIEAHVTKRAGRGFDEASLAAIRRYRFTPALLEGRKVRVRMNWAVRFELR